MDPPVYALKFSEDLLFEILSRHKAIKQCEKWGIVRNYLEMFPKERCPLPVYEAVLGLMEQRKDSIQASFDELCKLKVFNISDFRFELSLTSIMYFKDGYDHVKFLKYCALLGGLSVRYAKAGHHEIPTGCAQLLGYFLNFWMYTMVFHPNTDYFELAVVSQHVRRELVQKGIPEKAKVADEVDGQKVPEKGEKIQKMPEKANVDEELGKQVRRKEAEKKTQKHRKAAESAKAVHKVKEGRNVPKKKGGEEELPATQQKEEPNQMPPKQLQGGEGKYARPQKARRGGGKT